MRVRCKRVLLVCWSLLITIGAVLPLGLYGAAAQEGGNWFASGAPALSKIVDLADNTAPDSHPTDCTVMTYHAESSGEPLPFCLFQSPLGMLTAEGYIQTGDGRFEELTGPAGTAHFIPTADGTMLVTVSSGAHLGDYIGLYGALTKADLEHVPGFYGLSSYRVTRQPDSILRNPATGRPLQVNTGDISFSANGRWMIANMPRAGLVRVDMRDYSMQLFADSVEPEWDQALEHPPLAISNDGRYAAVNADLWGDGQIQIYDLLTCSDQSAVPATERVFCMSRNIWNGTSSPTKQVGLLNRQSDLLYPTRLRFADNDNLMFNARYARQSATEYKAATFVATAPGGVRHKLGLLGMGDSYISGEGTGVYRAGTDIYTNKCHLSELSYPFLLGRQNFGSYNSAACSGARTYDVVGSNPRYKGQATDGMPANQRDRLSILAGFQQGYLYQQEFAATYQPEAIVLSIGGNDIGFGNILKACIAPGTCYGTPEERAELTNTINRAYGKLVGTYKALRQQSGGARLYVVGYPQVANPAGSCGVNVLLNRDELAFVSGLVVELDSMVERAARDAGVFYADTQHAFDGHRLCEDGTSAMNGLTAGDDPITIAGHDLKFKGNESYHPTILGHELLARAIAAQTMDLGAPMPAQPAAEQAYTPMVITLPSGRPLNQVTFDDSMAGDAMLRGDAQQVAVDGDEVQLQPGSRYQIVLHSDPVLLDEGGVDADGNIATAVHIPADVPAGFHVLHVYGTNLAGQAVDIQKTVYVAAADEESDMTVVSGSTSVDGPAASYGVASISTAGADGPSGESAPLYATRSSSGEVLGAAVTTGGRNQPEESVYTADSTLRTVPQPDLFRVHWSPVVAAGLALTTLTTVLYYGVRRP